MVDSACTARELCMFIGGRRRHQVNCCASQCLCGASETLNRHEIVLTYETVGCQHAQC